MSRTLIRGGHLLDPASGRDGPADLFIEDGFIVASAPDFRPDSILDATGLLIIPGLIDIRARVREPGPAHLATLETETQAAVASGITTLCCPPDTDPVIESPAVAQMIQARAWQTGFAFIHPLGALTRGLRGEQLTDMAALDEAGCLGFSNGLAAVTNTQVLRHAFEYAATFGFTVFLHAEDPWLRGRGVVHEGVIAHRLGLPGVPTAAETVAVARDLALIEQTGVRAHFCQISSARAVEQIADAQQRGLPVTADTAVHYLHLSEQDVGSFNTEMRVRPPLRTLEDRAALRDAVRSGILTAVCSDHQPHPEDAKRAPFTQAEPGISGLDTLLPLMLRLVEDGVLTRTQAIAAVTSQAADILGIEGGSLAPGMTADLVLLDPAVRWTLTRERLKSQGHNTPFLGQTFTGRVQRTLVGGETVFLQQPD